jgi:hypothetical protein
MDQIGEMLGPFGLSLEKVLMSVLILAMFFLRAWNQGV